MPASMSEFDRLCDLVDLTDGFAFILGEIPAGRMPWLITKLRQCFGDALLIIGLPGPDESHLHDRLSDLVGSRSPQLMVVSGNEKYFPPTAGLDLADLSADRRDASREVIQPLNWGRNLLKGRHPYPILWLLPTETMRIFVAHTLDLVSWRAGYYRFVDGESTEFNSITEERS